MMPPPMTTTRARSGRAMAAGVVIRAGLHKTRGYHRDPRPPRADSPGPKGRCSAPTDPDRASSVAESGRFCQVPRVIVAVHGMNSMCGKVPGDFARSVLHHHRAVADPDHAIFGNEHSAEPG